MSEIDSLMQTDFTQILTGRLGDGQVKFFPNAKDLGTFQMVDAVWDSASLFGSNEVDGDGFQLDSRQGERARETILIEVPASLDVKDGSGFHLPTKPDGSMELWSFRRVDSQDTVSQTLRVVRSERRTTARPRVRKYGS